MKALVFGKTGQVATELVRLASQDVQIEALGRDQADLTNPDACAKRIADSDADVVINAAAYTAVDQAESQPELAMAVNGVAPTAMAVAAAEKGMPFLHVSTDYVFDGTGDRPFAPSDETGPLGVYGRTKLEGENGVRAAGGRYAILRTSWVFSAHGGNFVKTMLRLSDTHPELGIVSDQIGGPTPARDIAATLLEMARQMHAGAQGGTYHYSGTPDTSWAGFANEIFAQAQRDVRVKEIATVDYPTPAQRPLNSRLNCEVLETEFGIRQPDWTVGLARVLEALNEAKHDHA